MDGGQEVAWVGLAVSLLVAAHGLAPDPDGSPDSPGLALLMALVAVLIASWLVVDRRHHHGHHR